MSQGKWAPQEAGLLAGEPQPGLSADLGLGIGKVPSYCHIL